MFDMLKFYIDSEALGIVNFSPLHCVAIPRRDLSKKEIQIKYRKKDQKAS